MLILTRLRMKGTRGALLPPVVQKLMVCVYNTFTQSLGNKSRGGEVDRLIQVKGSVSVYRDHADRKADIRLNCVLLAMV